MRHRLFPSMEIDHLFLRAQHGAPEAALLRQLGLSEGSANQHPGQGTANRRFFFQNAYIELLWIADAQEIHNDCTRPTQLAERLQLPAGDSSPFGVCWRPSASHLRPPFASWVYQPPYLPAGMQVDIARHTPLTEPMWFYLAQATAPAAAPAERRQPLEHALGVQELSAVSITVPGNAAWSEAAQAASTSGQLHLQRGDAHLLELTFDHGRQGRHYDCRPALALILHT